MFEKFKEIKEKITLKMLIAAGLILAGICVVSIVIIYLCKPVTKEITIVCKYDDQVLNINNGETVTVACNTQVTADITNFISLDCPEIEWSYEIAEKNAKDQSAFEFSSVGGRSSFTDSANEKVKISAGGKNITSVEFYVEFVQEQKELEIKNTYWESGDIEYYLKDDGSVYILYRYEKNYIKGKYNYVRVDESEIDPEILKSFKEIIDDGLLYQIDIQVTEEYFDGKIYNNDSYIIYMYGNSEKRAIYDGGWDFVKEAKPVNKFDIKEIQEIFDSASKSANKKVSSKKLGSAANTAWVAKGVNYYFYDDGIFEAVSLINHDFIKGTYTCQEVGEDAIDEKIVNGFKELMTPKKYFYITCNVNKEIYNCDSINVTNLDIIIGQNGIKFALYDSNWDMVLDAEQIDMEAREDFDVLFDRTIVDITGEFSGKTYIANSVEYIFNEDGSFVMKDADNDTFMEGSYLTTDVYDDLIEESLLKKIKKKEYYYIEIDVDRIWHEKTGMDISNAPQAVFLIIAKDEESYLYNSYLGSFDIISDIKNIL